MDENSLITEKDLGPITVNRYGERFFFNLNRSNFDNASAQALFEKNYGRTLFEEDSLYVVVGTDSGLLPRFVQNKTVPKGTRYIFIEPESVLQVLQSQQMLVDLDERRIACIGLDCWADAIRDFKIVDYFYINNVHSYNAICAQDDYIQEYAEISWHIAEVLAQLHWRYTFELGSESFISRQIANIADNIYPARLLGGCFKDKTAIILAGGPSLDDALSWVRQHRQDVVVFAVSRISRQLISAAIEPDFVFSVDPTDLSFDISKEMLNFGDRTVFIHSYHTVPGLVNQWLGLCLFLGPRLPWRSELNVPNFDGVGPTVTNTALHVAYDFGFRRIILAGVDMCFTREGYTHATGSDEQLAGPRFNLTSLQVETNDGFMAPTSCDFAQAITSLGLQAKWLLAKGCRIINISGKAAKIDNIEFMPLAEIELKNEALDVMGAVLAKLTGSTNKLLYFQGVVEELKRARFQIKSIAVLAENARRINQEMYNSQGVIENYKDKRQLDLIEKKFKREYRQYSKLVKKYGIRSFIKLSKPFTDEDWTAEEAKQFGNVFYDAYQEGANKLLCLIDETIVRVSARREELVENPDFDLLISQYRMDKSFGRIKIWRQKTVPDGLPPKIATCFDEFEARFVEILANKNTVHFAKAKINSSLPVLKQRAGLLFKHRKLEELQDLSAGLEMVQGQAAAISYRYLLNGYLAELRDEPEEALGAYQEIVDLADELLEEALVRIAGISIDRNNADTANLSLQCLSQLNPLYLPLYAEMQRLRGGFMDAVSSYNSYIARFPDDTFAQIKLANLYAEHKVYDAAELMLDYILQKKPGLEAAVTIKNHVMELRTGEVGQR